MTDDRIRLVVLFGGQSAEHDVSCVSARHVLAAADPTKYDIEPVGITRTGEWVLAEDAVDALRRGVDTLPSRLEPAGPTYDVLSAVRGAPSTQRVVVLPLLHGPMGEDGTVQGLLEVAGVPYVGSGVLGSAITMDKVIAKQLLDHHGIPQAKYLPLRGPEIDADTPCRAIAELGLPIFVKPANLGSSIGVSKATTEAELKTAIDLALRYDEVLVLEEAIDGRELECSVLGNNEPRVSVPGEIRPGADFYDYADKYVDDSADLVIPAELPIEVTAAIQAMAIDAFVALRCEGMARADFFWDEGGRGLLVNELNSIPGFTPISMYPRLWAASGLPYPDLIDELVRLALERHTRRSHHAHTEIL